MKKIVFDFIRRGFVACGLGPMVLAVVYLILQGSCDVQTLSVNEVCIGIISLTALAFIAGGLNVVYQIERLPLMAAVLIHGIVLYVSYLATYLLNGWMQWGSSPVLAFTIIFVVGYLAIWAIIYRVTKKNTDKINRALNKKQQ